ncbi:MAG: Spy/CpxP family protein refolding chaperone [Rhizobiaceae bacterium]
MSWKKAAIIATVAALSFTGHYLISAQRVTAKANQAIAEFTPGGSHMNDWCNPSSFDKIEWIASWSMRDLDLSSDQQSLFDEVLAVSKASLADAEVLCTADREAIRALPLPDQLDRVQTMLSEAQTVLDAIAKPFGAFHASLSPEQAEKLKQLMNRENGHGRWHRRG